MAGSELTLRSMILVFAALAVLAAPRSRAAPVGLTATAGPVGLPSAETAPMTAAIAPPRDIAYPGIVRLAVDATDLRHGIFRVRETIPVPGPGPITLLYPQWLPGAHSPTGRIAMLAGLAITANGVALPWRRDPVEVHAFHVDVPTGVAALDLEFQFLSAVSTRQGRVMMTPDMLSLGWDAVALYPAGYFSRRIMFEPSVKLPDGFTLAGALEPVSTAGGVTTFKQTTFNTLVDSPLIAGRYFRRFDLDPGGPASVRLDVIADRPGELAATPGEIAAHVALVRQAARLFGSHHYDHYDFLLSLSDRMGEIGLEHHQSSEDGTIPNYFTDWEKTSPARDLLAHEYTHSWNGKFRRPADLWTANFNTPMRDSLLWVYEGQTQYWGYVLAARSGLMTKQQALDAIALTAATSDHRRGRAWKDLEDTTNDPIVVQGRPLVWSNWQRSEDYYSEGELIWLDADTLIRQLSGGKRSLDDFAKRFFGVDDGSLVTRTYTFEDVVNALGSVQPYDWASFLHARLEGHGPGAPLDGLTRGGYRLTYTDVESAYLKDAEAIDKEVNLSFSLGLTLDKEGTVTDVIWDGPAFAAGLTVGTKIVAVNGEAYDADGLKDAIREGKTSNATLEFLVKDNDRFRPVRIDYHGGPRYPHLERTDAAPARLDQILAPR